MRFQVRIGVLALLAGLLLCRLPGPLAAGERLPTLIYGGGERGRVVFDHQVHAAKGFRCADCHTDFAGTGKILFTTRKQGLISFADHTTGARCFACHNGDGVTADRKGALSSGERAFSDCDGCHRNAAGR